MNGLNLALHRHNSGVATKLITQGVKKDHFQWGFSVRKGVVHFGDATSSSH